jgi:hypothetical protein
MPIFPDNFAANSLSGTVLITDGHANLNLTTNPYALEGNKSFVIKLRKGGPTGLVIATSSPITLRDSSSIISLTANVSSVNEGNLVQFTLVTANAVDNSNVYYSVFPATANITTQDFFGANVGMATIISNQATFALRANADLSLMDETGENFRVQLRTNSPVGNIVYTTSNVQLLDVSAGYNILSFVENSSSVAEGGTLTLTFNATNIPVGTVFHYFTEGNATTSTFTGGNTGSFVMNGLSNTVTLLPTGVPYSTTQNFNVKLRALSNTGAVVATSNNIIAIDSALAYMTATGGNVITTGGYRIHTFNTSSVLNVTSLGALGSIDVLSIAGGGSGGGEEGSGSGGSGAGAGGYVYMPSVSAILGNLTVTIGAGGSSAANGGNTSVTAANFANILSVGGGKGGATTLGGAGAAGNGGSGGGSGNFNHVAGTGYGFPSPTQQGFPGGSSVINPSPFTYTVRTGGGGAGAAGQSGTSSQGGNSGDGGIGKQTNISGSNVYYAGGGGGGYTPGSGGYYPNRGIGGLGGGGDGGSEGIVNSGGGGGGGLGSPGVGYSGGSGVVIIRYPYVAPPTISNVLVTANLFSVGSNITFTINAQNANLTTLYYTTDGNVIASNFIGGNTGSFVANASGGIVTLQSNTNIPLNESRSFRLQIRQDSTTGFISGSSANVTIDGFALQILATGGDVITAGGYRTHTFLTSNNFVLNKKSTDNIEYLIVAGGGSGGLNYGGGGGAGGMLYGNLTYQQLTSGIYSIVVGSGGTSSGNGSNSSVFSMLSIGGGGGGNYSPLNTPVDQANARAKNGGSGGGGHSGYGGYQDMPGLAGWAGGRGVTGQGFPGGNRLSPIGNEGGGYEGAGGGGAGSIAANVSLKNEKGGNGGIGLQWVNGTYYAGGGGGWGYQSPTSDAPSYLNTPYTQSLGLGGLGGGGNGTKYYPGRSPAEINSTRGSVNTGGGGGGATGDVGNISGGSGIVIIRYPYI